MAESIIEVEHLHKMYRLGEINTGSLSHDITRWFAKWRGKQDPFEALAETNARDTKGSSRYVWSLHDVNFSVLQGEVFGIVGRNGAGKSTLLKILSKITKPTKGAVRIGGRVASLLEVGTGFHPDLSGRENIFLNGAILGMRKQEIKNRFDEIVAFSGVERYIDTPVKRYSSGMFVRLAFAVAAHLEPEILIIDEVLAVGDSEFQQKCMGKMRDVSRKQGRTILFVSHNIPAVKQLCHRALLLENGKVQALDTVENVLRKYQSVHRDTELGLRGNLPEKSKGYFVQWHLLHRAPGEMHQCVTGEEVIFACRFEAFTELVKCEFQLRITNQDGVVLVHTASAMQGLFTMAPGIYECCVKLELPLRKGDYEIEMGIISNGTWIDTWASTTRLHVMDNYDLPSHTAAGILQLPSHFTMKALNQVLSY